MEQKPEQVVHSIKSPVVSLSHSMLIAWIVVIAVLAGGIGYTVGLETSKLFSETIPIPPQHPLVTPPWARSQGALIPTQSMQSYLIPTAPWNPSSIEAVSTQAPSVIPSGHMSYFESMLANDCKSGLISIDKAPVVINQNLTVYPISETDPPQSLRCSVGDEYRLIVGLDKSSCDTLEISNKDDYLSRKDAVPFYDDGEVVLNVFLDTGGDAPPEATPIGISGIKTLTMKDGGKAYVYFAVNSAIPPIDHRLVSLYQRYEKLNYPWPSNEEIKKEFFSDLSNLQVPEKSAMALIKNVLNAVTAR